MSGPKSYSTEVVDKHLKVFFRLLSEVETLWDILNQRSIIDKKRNIAISGSEMTRALKPLYDEMASPTFNQSGEVLSQAEFDAFYNQIINVTNKQKLLIQTLTDHINDLDLLEEAYAQYVELGALADQYKRDFEELKVQLSSNAQTSKGAKSTSELIIKNIQQAVFAYHLPEFNIENARSLEKERAKMQRAFEASRSTMIKASRGIAAKRTGDVSSQKVQLVAAVSDSQQFPLTLHQKELMGKIKLELTAVKEIDVLPAFEKRFKNLQSEKSNNLNFMLAELLEDIKIHKQQFHFRHTLKKIEMKLQSSPNVPAELTDDFEHLKSMVGKTLGKDVIKTSELLKIKEFEAAFAKKTVDRQNMILQQTAENNFIKARLISALQDMNFEVVADAEIIDLEQTGSYLLRIPGQKNFLNLRFDDSGRMLYNFLIPENKSDLSMDDKNLKLAEMEEACNEFKTMLSDLKQRGLKIDLNKEIDISEKALISLPAHIQSKIAIAQTANVNRRKGKSLQNRRRPGT